MVERKYITCCQTYNLVPFPVTEPTLTVFAVTVYTQGLEAGTVQCYLAAVCHSQVAIGLGDSLNPGDAAVLKGLKRKAARRQQWI